MQIPDKKIFDTYNIEISNVVPFRDGYLISSIEDRFLLRKIDFSINRLLYICRAKEYLTSKGFTNMDRLLVTANGDPYINIFNNTYIMTTIPKGRECNLLQRDDVLLASRGLGELHKATMDFNGGNGPETRTELFRFPTYFSKRLEELKKLKKIAKKGNKEFDSIFLKCSESFIDIGERAIRMLEKSDYEELCRRTEKDGSFCHHDYTHSNILVADTNVNIINFDYICPELRVYDLANFLRRKLRKCNWSFKEGQYIIDEYMSVQSLSVEELRVMGIMLMFPQKMWRVCNKYYNSRRSFYEKGYIGQLKEVIDELEPSSTFIEKYENEYCK